MGESGSGKTTSMRNLNPKETFYFDCDKKGLSWKGWKEQYNEQNKNYIATSDVQTIMTLLSKISNEQPQIKVVVIDTLNAIMIDDEFSRMKEKGYDKWQELAYSIYGIINMCNVLRKDLVCILVMHSQTERDENTGEKFTRAKTSGRKLDKIVVESKITSVLLAKCVDGKYIFETRNNNSTCKTPLGAFTEDYIENDIVKVINALKEY
jgi:hypothetical protein